MEFKKRKLGDSRERDCAGFNCGMNNANETE